MIRYDVAPEQVVEEVKALAPTWLQQAAQRTQQFLTAGAYEEAASIWSTVKPVFIRLQKRKCVFCERQFETADFGTIEYDLEHFRPKSSVKAWPPRGWAKQYDFNLGQLDTKGYFWLAYDLANYAASCKVCNSPLKANYFPVARARGQPGASGADLRAEQPFLCYPIGRGDENPERLITFVGTTAVPVARSGMRRRRAEVIIDFFQLNAREQLHKERARVITVLGAALRDLADGRDVEENREVVQGFLSDAVPHGGCLRAFERLWQTDQGLAHDYYRACRTYAASVDAPVPVPGPVPIN